MNTTSIDYNCKEDERDNCDLHINIADGKISSSGHDNFPHPYPYINRNGIKSEEESKFSDKLRDS
jgi:hypothetical protein